MIDIQVGDKVNRVMNGFREGELWRNEGHVTAVDDRQIVCMIQVDTPRMMTFSRKTGINYLGKEFGWLEKVQS